MSLLDIPWEKTPDHVNDKGVKWWVDKDTTRYAREKLGDNVVVWYTEEPNGRRTRLLTVGDEIEFETQQLEGMLFHIDMLNLVRKE
ncbi:hypothetical protein C4565_00585 [Candidatus Parcubacteria bacterium]|nr:MAG: hypothetical protein C4565_00585 [Candidatus Parcubacteria bacterium]